jgi:hypothetical protein
MIPLTDKYFGWLAVLIPNRPRICEKNDPINPINPLTGIPLCGFHCNIRFS